MLFHQSNSQCKTSLSLLNPLSKILTESLKSIAKDWPLKAFPVDFTVSAQILDIKSSTLYSIERFLRPRLHF